MLWMTQKSSQNFVCPPDMINTIHWSKQIALHCSAKLASTLFEHWNSKTMKLLQVFRVSDWLLWNDLFLTSDKWRSNGDQVGWAFKAFRALSCAGLVWNETTNCIVYYMSYQIVLNDSVYELLSKYDNTTIWWCIGLLIWYIIHVGNTIHGISLYKYML